MVLEGGGDDGLPSAAGPDNDERRSCAGGPWGPLSRLEDLHELDLVTMRFANVRPLLAVVGPQLTSLTLEMGEEQGVGSEIVHLGRCCPELRQLKLLLGDCVLKGEMTLHFGSLFFRRLERLTVEGSVHLHAFAFLWGHCRKLRHMQIGLVISNELTNTNMLIHDVFTLLFQVIPVFIVPVQGQTRSLTSFSLLQVNAMTELEEFHVRNLKIRSLQMGKFLLDSLPRLRRASNWLLDLSSEDITQFRQYLLPMVRERGLRVEYSQW